MSIMEKVSEMMHHETAGMSIKALMLDLIGQFGGVSGLISRFRENGLTGLVESWMMGKDLDKLSSTQVDSVLGNEVIQKLSTKAGVKPEIVSEHLSKALPSVIHLLCPNGQIPTGPITEDMLTTGILDRVKGLFKKSA